MIEHGNYNEKEVGEFLGQFRSVRNHANYDKEFGYDDFLEQLRNMQFVIENIADSIIYLRKNVI